MAVTAAKLLVVVDGDVSGAVKAYDTVERRGQKSADSLKKVGRGLETGVKVAAVGVAAGFGLAVAKTMQFDKRMSAVQAKAGGTTADLKAMRDTAIDLGAKTIFSASEAADGMEILAAAGLNADQVIAAMPGTLNAAAASGEDFATTADIMVATMGQFGKKAKDMGEIGDVLAKASNMSAVGMTDLGLSLKYAGPVAATLGMSLEETSAALVVLGNNGIKADSAGTALRMGLLQLQAPAKKGAKVMEDYGISLKDADGNAKGLPGILDELKSKMKGLSQTKKVELLKKLVGTESVSAFLQLMDAGSEGIDKITKSLEDSEGAAKKAADTMTDNLWGSIEQLKGSAESAAIAIGTAYTPRIKELAESITGVTDSFNALDPERQRFIIDMALMATGASVAVVGVAKMVEVVGTLAGAYKALIAMQAAQAIFGALLSPVGLAALAIGGVVTLLAGQALAMERVGDMTPGYTQLIDSVTGAYDRQRDAADRATKSGSDNVRAMVERNRATRDYEATQKRLDDLLKNDPKNSTAIAAARDDLTMAELRLTDAKKAAEAANKKATADALAVTAASSKARHEKERLRKETGLLIDAVRVEMRQNSHYGQSFEDVAKNMGFTEDQIAAMRDELARLRTAWARVAGAASSAATEQARAGSMKGWASNAQASGGVTPNARGGYYDTPTVGLLGEAAWPDVVVPMNPSDSGAYALLAKAMKGLGIGGDTKAASQPITVNVMAETLSADKAAQAIRTTLKPMLASPAYL